jgi:hypothetical protein
VVGSGLCYMLRLDRGELGLDEIWLFFILKNIIIMRKHGSLKKKKKTPKIEEILLYA